MRTATVFLFLCCSLAPAADLPANRWVELKKDAAGARRGSAIRYASGAGAFFLWGFMNADPDLLQEHPLMRIPEYDMVYFDPGAGKWENHLPRAWEEPWRRELPLAYVPRTYSGITTGSERTTLRVATDEPEAAPRPDLNIVFDQVVYRPEDNSLYYFTGGLTAKYDVGARRWSDLEPKHSPPPVLGGSLAHDPIRDEILLFGGGHVAERGADGVLRGDAGAWVYSVKGRDWRRLQLRPEPRPRMNARMVCDTRNQALVLFGGDGQTHYLADTWLFDLKTHTWRQSKAAGPPARAGHFTVYDPDTGLVIVGGGYNRNDLADMWGYDVAADKWRKLRGEVPAGFYLSGDIAPEKRLILLATNTRTPGDRMTCNILFPVRTTFAYRIEREGLFDDSVTPQRQQPMPKRAPEEAAGMDPDPVRRQAQRERLEKLPDNHWVELPEPGRAAPARTWGSATFDTDRGQILYWGGGHCGYEGSDVDAYVVAEHTWRGDPAPDFPERLWNHGVRLAGVTFTGRPWSNHGRKVYAYDPTGKRLIVVEPVRLTAGYEPEWLRSYPSKRRMAPDAVAGAASSYRKFVTWSYDPDSRAWKIVGPAPAGVDTLVSTPHGVVGLPVNWPGRLNDAGYQRPWRAWHPPEDNAPYLLRGDRWEKLGGPGPSPQNLYEMTSLAYDSKRDQIVLHGGGARRDELWTFDIKSGRWTNRQPKVIGASDGRPPVCARESVYIPGADVVLSYGPPLWVYSPSENSWRPLDLPVNGDPQLHERASQNRAMVYDPARNLVFLVLGGRGDTGIASVFALRYRQ
ncbi:MAG: hypothetical protein KIT09_28655 [Bryobacteraceae bacterium]|nr:hypothetical protein [Bryobacteraceae bacterium]